MSESSTRSLGARPKSEPSGFVLRVVSSNEGLTGMQVALAAGRRTIGRAADCDVVLTDPSVSRHHAEVEIMPEGLRVADLGSANRVWIDHQPIDSEATIGPGQRFRIGSTVFAWAEPLTVPRETQLVRGTLFLAQLPPPAALGQLLVEDERFSLRIVSADERALVGREFPVTQPWAMLGSSEECTIVLDDPHVSPQHAKLELRPDGFRLTDLGSSSGTWIGSLRVAGSAMLKPGQSFRLGPALGLECLRLRDQQVTTGATVVIAATERAESSADLLGAEGDPIEIDPHSPFLLDQPEIAWYVESGGVDLYTVRVVKGQSETRTHFLEVRAGQCFFGFDLRGTSAGFLAVGIQESRLRKIPLARLRELTATPARAAIAALVDAWIAGVGQALQRGQVPADPPDAVLEAGHEASVEARRRVAARDSVVWVEILSGGVLFDDLATPIFTRRRALFPVTPHSWVQRLDEMFDDPFIPVRTSEAMANADFWANLGIFHEVACECVFILAGLRLAGAKIRLDDKVGAANQAKIRAMQDIRSVMAADAPGSETSLAPGGRDPVFHACTLVGQTLGITVKRHRDLDDIADHEEKVTAISRASGFRKRAVALRDEWWTQDQGPLLGKTADSDEPVVLLPVGSRAYDCVDPVSGSRRRVDAAVAEGLAPFAQMFYRSFPATALSVRDVVEFGARGLKSDFRWLVGTGILLGALGTLTPFLTGRIVDAAIPQADRALLVTFGLALLGSALASTAFKLTQGFATLRVQSKMEFAVQSGVWDRILDLPANFFRQYSAGDLSDRAAGVDAIQNLVSGAGVGAILGSLSGTFYVFLMLTYDVRLTFVAIVLTLVFVGVTTLANYLQLRHQRVESTLRGTISGLVLNLINGVPKLRVAGAENYAFHVWARHFAELRRISFKIGKIQNVVTVFNAVYPTVSSIVIFATLLKARLSAAEGSAEVLTTGDFIAFTSAYGLFLTAMQALGDASLNMLRVVPIYERIRPIVTTRPEVDESKAAPGKLNGAIELSRVSFRYEKDGPPIINDVSLKIEPGEFVAFVGGSGCGKSTLLRLLLGFEQPERGVIRYDGKDLETLDLRMLREQLGVVLQVSRVMPAEIYRNIVGISTLTLEHAWAAAEKAGLADDIRAMPMQMHTYVSEGGGTLSGGQRQRLLIARALVNDPKILFLDEATSALDNRAQATVTASMDRMDATRIVIAHRLSTIINADKIYYLEKGSIAEEGTYSELMAKGGLFAALARRQIT